MQHATRAYAVSWDGRVAVGAGGDFHTSSVIAIRWVDGQLIPMATPGYVQGSGAATSSDGSVIAGAMVGPNSHYERYAFRWENDTFVEIQVFENAYSGILGMTPEGANLVGWTTAPDSSTRAFVWRSGQVELLPSLSLIPGSDTFANGISHDGLVVVGSSEDSDFPSTRHAVWWREGKIEILGSLGGRSNSALAISGDGRVPVGDSETLSGNRRPTKWIAGNVVDLGTFGGATGSAYGVSLDGAMIVGSALDPTLGVRAALWRDGVGIADLNTLYAQYIPAGWRLTFATGISPDGRFIVGHGVNAQGRSEAWHLDTVSEPAAIVSLIGGLLLLRIRRHSCGRSSRPNENL